MTRFSVSSLRVRLLLVVLLATLPAFGLILYSTLEQRRLAARDAHAGALRLARIAAESHKDLIETGHHLLVVLAALPEVRGDDPATCSALFADLLTRFPRHTNVVAARPNGEVFCSGLPLGGPVNFADRPYFRQTLETRDFAVSDYLIGRISGKPVVTLSYPSLDTSGAVRAVVSVAVGLDWLGQLAAESRLPPGSTMTVVDRAGTILARVPDAERWVGKTVPEAPIIRAILNRTDEGTTQTTGVDGIERLYAFSPLRGPERVGNVYVSVGIPTAIAFAEVQRSLVRNLVGFGLVTGLMLVAAWVASDLLILRRVRVLTGAARQLAAGELITRAKLGTGRDELGALATTFDAMAESLETRTKELSRSERRFANIVDTAADAIISIDADQRIVRYNRGAERIFGYSARDVVGQPLDVLLPTHLTEVHRRHVRDFATAPETARQMGERKGVSGRRKDGTEFPAEASISKVVHEGETTFTVVLRDITERKRAEAALRESEALFRSAFEESGVGMALQGLDGQYLRVNRALCEMLGYSEPELLARTFHATTHPEDRDVDVDADRRVLAGEIRSSHQREKRYLHKLGHVVWAVVNVSLVHARDGAPMYFLLQSQDSTLRKQAEEAQAQLEDQLRQTQKVEAVGRLAGGVAHDFNNLLTVITGRAEMLLSRLGSDDPLRRHVQLIGKTAERAAALTRQLLAFSRKQVLQPKVLDLQAVVAGMEKMLRRLIGEDIELVAVPDPALGRVKADPGQLEQVILNLVVNARDAMPEGGRLTLETADVELDEAYARRHAGATPGRYVMLAVSDTGVGMDAATQARLFEPFFTTKGPGKGTGLGLATVYGIVKQSGGNIWVYSEPGRGTTFKIYLPRVDEAVEAVEPGQVLAEWPRGWETVLLVEDEEGVRDLAREIIQLQGYTVLEARHPGEALLVNEEHAGRIHLLVTDVVMPQMSGRELADRLASMRSETKVLYMSGYTDDAIVRHGVLDAHTPFVQKPFTPEALLRKIREVLDTPRKGGAQGLTS